MLTVERHVHTYSKKIVRDLKTQPHEMDLCLLCFECIATNLEAKCGTVRIKNQK